MAIWEMRHKKFKAVKISMKKWAEADRQKQLEEDFQRSFLEKKKKESEDDRRTKAIVAMTKKPKQTGFVYYYSEKDQILLDTASETLAASKKFVRNPTIFIYPELISYLGRL